MTDIQFAAGGEGRALVKAFDSVRWQWGGRWSGEKDYQHFSKTGT